ncbi:JAB domain-containing protein [Tsuneonella sp. HG222]
MARAEGSLTSISEDMLVALIATIGQRRTEFLVIFALTEEHRFLRCIVKSGGMDSATAEYRSILGDSIACGAHALVLAHNHPSGRRTPSQGDIVATRSLAALGSPLRIAVHDHLIVTRDSTFSMRKAGMLGHGK